MSHQVMCLYRRLLNFGLVLLLMIAVVVVGGLWLHAANPLVRDNRSSVAKTGASGILLYAQRDQLWVYHGGKSKLIGMNPAGFDSLDFWLGYSAELGGVVFHRGFDRYWRLLRFPLDFSSLSTEDIGFEWSVGRSLHQYSVVGDRLYQIRGYGRRAGLWYCSRDGAWTKQREWVLPAQVPVSEKWVQPVSIGRDGTVFFSPSFYLLAGNTHSSSCRILAEGNPRWKPGDDAYSPTPVISPDGTLVAFTRRISIPENGGVMQVVPLAGGKPRHFRLLDSRSDVTLESCQWFPDGRHVLCSFSRGCSGTDLLCTLEIETGASTVLPFTVERDQWCVMPQTR